MEKTHYCYDCRFYRAYYTMGLCYFDKLKYGKCAKHDNLLCKNHESCDKWERNSRHRELRKTIALKKIIQASEDLSMLRQILYEESEQNQ